MNCYALRSSCDPSHIKKLPAFTDGSFPKVLEFRLAVESAHPGVGFLGVDIVSLIFDVMVPLDVFPVRIMSPEDFSYAGFENKGGMDIRCP